MEVARWAARQAIPAARKHLRDQLLRSVDSVVLNIAEGAGHPPAGGGVALPGGSERQADLRRIGAMLASLVR